MRRQERTLEDSAERGDDPPFHKAGPQDISAAIPLRRAKLETLTRVNGGLIERLDEAAWSPRTQHK